MGKKLIPVFCAVIVLSLAVSALSLFGVFGGGGDSGVTVVKAPAQSEAERPDCIPDPQANWIKLPEGTNLAEGRPVSAGEITDVYTANNVNDGDVNTYWESKGFPAEVTFTLDGTHTVGTVAVRLNPSAVWEARTQGFAVLVSTDGSSFTEVAADAKYDFNPDTGNVVRVDFSPVQAAYVRLVFSANSSARTGGAQAAEIMVFE